MTASAGMRSRRLRAPATGGVAAACLVLALVGVAGGCAAGDSQAARRSVRAGPQANAADHSFGVYPLADEAITLVDAAAVPPRDLKLAEAPILSADGILEYDWRTHKIRIAPGAIKHRRGRRRGWPPVVVVVDGDPCCLAVFSSGSAGIAYDASLAEASVANLVVEVKPQLSGGEWAVREWNEIIVFPLGGARSGTGPWVNSPGWPTTNGTRTAERVRKSMRAMGKLRERGPQRVVGESQAWRLSVRSQLRADGRDHNFGIYLLADSGMTWSEAQTVDVGDLRLAEAPVISDDDVVEYDWLTHAILLAPRRAERLFDPAGINVGSRPFVVVADGEPCYLGSFYSADSSTVCLLPVIMERPTRRTARGGIRIHRASRPVSEPDDPRQDERVRKCLKAMGRLHERAAY